MYVWSMNSVRIPETTVTHWNGAQVSIRGTAIIERSPEWLRHVEWSAIALSGGWYISIFADGTRVGEAQGSGFNLPLEVASAINRLL